MAEVVPCSACGKKNRVPTTARGTPRCASCHESLPWLVDADEKSFAGAVDTSVPVLVDVWAPWCGPCRTIAPAVQRVAKDFAGRLKVVKVNADIAPGISAQFGVQGIPTLLMLRDGQVVDRQVGALPAERLVDWVRANVDQTG